MIILFFQCKLGVIIHDVSFETVRTNTNAYAHRINNIGLQMFNWKWWYAKIHIWFFGGKCPYSVHTRFNIVYE